MVILPCFQSLLKSSIIMRERSCWKQHTPFCHWQNDKILGGFFSPGFFFSFTKAMKYRNYFTAFVQTHCADHNLVIAGIYEILCGRWKHCQHTHSDVFPLLLPQICYWFPKPVNQKAPLPSLLALCSSFANTIFFTRNKTCLYLEKKLQFRLVKSASCQDEDMGWGYQYKGWRNSLRHIF